LFVVNNGESDLSLVSDVGGKNEVATIFPVKEFRIEVATAGQMWFQHIKWLSPDTLKCDCAAILKTHNITCNINDHKIERRGLLWISI